jgi:hypothetical protein
MDKTSEIIVLIFMIIMYIFGVMFTKDFNLIAIGAICIALVAGIIFKK